MRANIPHGFHDAHLISIILTDARNGVSIGINDGDSNYLLSFELVRAFRVVDMQATNIINNLIIYSGGCVESEVTEILGWISSTVTSASYMNKNVISRYVDEITSGNLALFYFEPSAGAEVGILCGDVQLNRTFSESSVRLKT